MKKILMSIVGITFFWWTSGFAVKVSSLYEADIAVSSQASDARAQAIQDGFLQVLTKLSGDPDISQHPDIKSILARADYYVQEYNYALPSPASSQYILQIRYNRRDVNTLLKRSEIAYWGENRPLILVWLSVTNAQHPAEIVNSDNGDEVVLSVKQQGKRYGLPLIFPMMDMAEMNRVGSSDVSNMPISLIKEVGKRYLPDAFLIGDMHQGEDGRYQSEWQLVLGDTHWSWRIMGKTADDVVDEVLGRVSQAFVKRYVVSAAKNTPQAWLKLEVSSVRERHDLVQLMQYLKQLAQVEKVELSQVSGDSVQLSVLVRGSSNTFQRNASIGQHLVLKSEDHKNNQLSYEWTR